MGKTLLHILYRAAQLMLLSLIVYGLAMSLPADLAWLMAGDMLTYFEAAGAIWLAAQATRLRWAFAYARALLRRPLRRLRTRARRAARRIGRPSARDDDGGWGALAPA
jgi:hypothetical protein